MASAAPIPPKHGYPKDRYMPKCTTEYATIGPSGDVEPFDTYEAAKRHCQAHTQMKPYARITTEWIEIEDDAVVR